MKQCQVIQEIEAEQLKKNLPEFRVGDTICIHQRIIEGDKERIQMLQVRSSLVVAEGFLKLLPFIGFLMAQGLKESICFTAQKSQRSKSSERVKCVRANSIIFEELLEKPLRFKSISVLLKKELLRKWRCD